VPRLSIGVNNVVVDPFISPRQRYVMTPWRAKGELVINVVAAGVRQKCASVPQPPLTVVNSLLT
jgi:hypothetical protein